MGIIDTKYTNVVRIEADKSICMAHTRVCL